MDFKIITHTDKQAVENQVKEFMNKGWMVVSANCFEYGSVREYTVFLKYIR